MKLQQNHITFQSQDRVKHLIAPLTKLADIHYFSYGVNYQDSSCFTLLSDPEYYDACLENELPLVGFTLQSGWHYWDTALSNAQRSLLASRNTGQGIMLVKHHHDKTEIMEFAAKPGSQNVSNFYLNNLPLLEKFIQFFKSEAADLIQAGQNQAFVPTQNMTSCNLTNQLKVNGKIHEFLAEINDPLSFLSKREMEIFSMLIQGFKLAEVSKRLNIAIPTVANYVLRIKTKSNCTSRKEMIDFAKMCGLIQYNMYM